MNHLSLAARYRPQTFAEVAGQPMAAAALSRAAAEDRVAPAYLLSGTRGVGKTTIARIFAKALNCQHGPAAEPCNECAQCRQVTAGNHIDVNEIDAASNTGVDDVRALRETIGFVPMEGRYKIFIIDEAHMLSKSAFNALLKTLEEPPAHTVFILATTEAHRFPATILSRCQHFVFRHLPEQTIYEHLVKILQNEKIEFEPDGVRIVSRRAAGSVRDSLSLLDQALALTTGKLEAATVREALGVAGPELYSRLLNEIASGDCAGIVQLAGDLLGSGVDLGFFTRELGALLRNLFLVRQSGEKILASIANLTEDEKTFLKKEAGLFSTAHLHSAWQMLLECQRGIAQSPEPGAALELLLINISLLPQLLPVGRVETTALPNTAHAPVTADPDAPASAPEMSAIDAQEVRSEEDVPKEGTPDQDTPEAAVAPGRLPGSEAGNAEQDSSQAPNGARSWQDFCDFCRNEQAEDGSGLPQDMLRLLSVDWQDGKLFLTAPSRSHWERMSRKMNIFRELLGRFCNENAPEIIFPEPQPPKSRSELLEEGGKRPELQLCQKILDARISEFIEDSGSEQ